MHLDVRELHAFYYRTRLGRAVQKAIRDQVRDMWPEAKGQTVVGFGFTVPLLRPFLEDARRVIGLMPGPQGVMPWPTSTENISVLCEESQWPLPNGIVDKLIVLHGLETSEQPTNIMSETDRVLGPGGRALFVVPSRTGLWARRDKTPFGHGRPYTLMQLESQLKKAGFSIERHRAALFAPPSERQFWLKSASLVERMGQKLPTFSPGGVLMVEVSKKVAAPTGTAVKDRVRNRLGILEGIPKPTVEPI